MFDAALPKHPLLTLEQELELGQRIQAGDQAALDELVKAMEAQQKALEELGL